MNLFRFIIPKSSVEYIKDTSTVRQAIEKMRYHSYAAIPVINDAGIYVGTLRNDDILRYIIDRGDFSMRDAEREAVIEIIDLDYSKPLYHTASPSELIERAKEHNFVPIVDDRGCFIGIVLRRDVLDFLVGFYEPGIEGKR